MITLERSGNTGLSNFSMKKDLEAEGTTADLRLARRVKEKGLQKEKGVARSLLQS
jgi:hypothetical protein